MSGRGLEAAVLATVGVCDAQGGHRGQGLLLDIEGTGAAVLTCYHVVAPVDPKELTVRVPGSDRLLRPSYDTEHSRPERDAVVLRVTDAPTASAPLLHALDPKSYDGRLPATGITRLVPARFDATLAPATSLSVPVTEPGHWPDPPERYQLESVFRLAEPTDTRRGISGAVVLCEDGVVGLAHFARAAAAEHEREGYVVPLSAWAENWPALEALIEPFIDRRLRSAATVKRPDRLVANEDLNLAGYRPDVYVAREPDTPARRTLEEDGVLIVVGRPKSGKTRLVWELLQAAADQLVVVPRRDVPPELFETAGLRGKKVVLVFDDLHRTALGSDPIEWQRRLVEATGNACPVVCTTRDGDEWKTVREQPRLGRLVEAAVCLYTSRSAGTGQDLVPEQAYHLGVRLGLSNAEIERRFDGTPGSLVLDMRAMAERYERLRDEGHGGVSMSRLLDAAKLVHAGEQPYLRQPLLRAAAERVRGDGPIGRETWETLCRRTDEAGFGRFVDDEFQTYRPYLEECVHYEPAREELEALGGILQEIADWEGLEYLAWPLERYGSTLAESTARAALAGGREGARASLAVVLARKPGGEAEAERTLQELVDEGDAAAAFNLGELLSKDPARLEEAKAAYRTAVDRGLPIASWALARVLKQQGLLEEAEVACRVAVHAGYYIALVRMAQIIASDPSRLDEAEAILNTALRAVREGAGYAPPAEDEVYAALGGVLSLQPGREDEAEQAYRDAIRAAAEGGPTRATLYASTALGRLLLDAEGRKEEAEAVLRGAADSGYPDALHVLGTLLYWQDRLDEAEAPLRQAAAAGLAEASRKLGSVLYDQQRLPEAAEAWRAAAKGGVEGAHYLLGRLYAEWAGHDEQAEAAWGEGADAGDPYCCAELARLLKNRGNHEAAEKLYRTAINRGLDVRGSLGAVLAEQPNRVGEAEELLAGAGEAGDAEALTRLGRLLAKQPRRDEDAERAYRAAADTGHPLAIASLGAFLWERERSDEAKEILRSGSAAGIPEADFILGLLLIALGEDAQAACEALGRARDAEVPGSAEAYAEHCA